MYVREKKNKSGSVSIQIIRKENGRSIVVETVGCGALRQEIDRLKIEGRRRIQELQHLQSLFREEEDQQVLDILSSITNANVEMIGPERVFGTVFDYIGYGTIGEELFRHLVVARIAFPLSKLRTSEYLKRYTGIDYPVDKIYRFLDKVSDTYKEKIEEITFQYAKKRLGGAIGLVFYDMTTLYFEASEEDELRKTGFSKDGKHSNPQIFIGLLISLDGYAIGYDVYEGNTVESKTLIPFLKNMEERFKLDKPVVVADAGLLTNNNIMSLEKEGYQYIIGARIKNETKEIKKLITSHSYTENPMFTINKGKKKRLIVNYSSDRAKKDKYNRKKGLERLKKRVATGKLTKDALNNRGYNKYLKLEGEVTITIDKEAFDKDAVWDGLKGYITNSDLAPSVILENYRRLWLIERAFRISKTDLRIRPIYHYLERRIRAHICIAFVAYSVYIEVQNALYRTRSNLTMKNVLEAVNNMYQITIELPISKQKTQIPLKCDAIQEEICDIIKKEFT